MTTIITVTEMPSMPGRYECTHKADNDERVYSSTHAGRNPEAAAAYAMRIAISTPGAYVVLGPKKVLDCIPSHLRARQE